jgi:hypothetical protein
MIVEVINPPLLPVFRNTCQLQKAPKIPEKSLKSVVKNISNNISEQTDDSGGGGIILLQSICWDYASGLKNDGLQNV